MARQIGAGMMRATAGVVVLAALSMSMGCGGTSAQGAPSPTSANTAAAGVERYVTIGFWTDRTCSGDPVSTNRFPVHYGDSQCYSWPGRSGENSASRFSCGPDSFSYTQWTTLTCSGGQNPSGTRKDVNVDRLHPGRPAHAVLPHSRLQRMSGCGTVIVA